MKEESDSDTKLDTDGRCRSVEANSVDRYISTLHCNLDSRYQVSGLLAMEMRKPQNFAHHKGLLQSWKRSTAFGAGINLQSDKLDSSESINADELPPRCWRKFYYE
ncbi:unnamed protein product [Dicrocoelium dendriticum]|nr:unnamed protein product [Dicrocoelium dendriticum]